MKPLYVRPLTEEERQVLRQSLKSSCGFTVRRAQMLLPSAEGRKVAAIGQQVGCQGQAVHEGIHAFHVEDLSCLRPKAKGNPRDRRALDDTARNQLRELIRHSPREVGYETSLWTLDLLAEACVDLGLSGTRVSGETICATLAVTGIDWRRAKQRITSPDRLYTVKKTAGLAERAGPAA